MEGCSTVVVQQTGMPDRRDECRLSNNEHRNVRLSKRQLVSLLFSWQEDFRVVKKTGADMDIYRHLYLITAFLHWPWIQRCPWNDLELLSTRKVWVVFLQIRRPWNVLKFTQSQSNVPRKQIKSWRQPLKCFLLVANWLTTFIVWYIDRFWINSLEFLKVRALNCDDNNCRHHGWLATEIGRYCHHFCLFKVQDYNVLVCLWSSIFYCNHNVSASSLDIDVYESYSN